MNGGMPHSRGLHQFDIETGKIVSEWKLEKDGTDITMRDIRNESKGAQMDPSVSTFLGLDDNRLCRWGWMIIGVISFIGKRGHCIFPLLRKNLIEELRNATQGELYELDEAIFHCIIKKLHVTSPYGNNLHHQENVTHGQFAFTTTLSGNYLACFWKDNSHNGGGNMSIGLDWKTRIAAKDWDSVAKKEKNEKLEGAVEAIHENFIYLKDREDEDNWHLEILFAEPPSMEYVGHAVTIENGIRDMGLTVRTTVSRDVEIVQVLWAPEVMAMDKDDINMELMDLEEMMLMEGLGTSYFWHRK
ncbi:unnamed protein product [Fraxinus pennsylvanica]|uniref:GOLD domain-containing protein n=1 Tax=Fraxinus pennsylvanica TaxID=56036 RepID=A0AAD1ZJ20_9LAMI|nr:unnamed protein product [Fraxinus pennsylvanica]